MTICCRYDINVSQSNNTYGEVKQSMFTNIQASEPEYEAIDINHKPTDCDVEMDANPAYQATS